MEEVLPHFLSIETTVPQYDAGFFNNVAMRMGEVVAIHTPDGAANTTKKKQTQYTVRVQHRDGRGMLVDVLYRCTMGDLFGGVGDSVRFTARKGTKDSNKLGNGSRVLIACPNGETNAAVIVGGIKHPDSQSDTAEGHHFDFEFNGVRLSIDDSGELTLSVNGATDANGKPDDSKTDPKYRGSTISISKTGNVRIANNGSESIEIDTPNKTIKVRGQTGDTDMDGDWKLHTEGNVSIAADQGVVVEAQGEARLNGSTVKLGGESASEPLVLGNQLRAALNDLISTFSQASTTFGMLGASPVTMHPTLVAGLARWMAKYAVGAYLSSSKFTE